MSDRIITVALLIVAVIHLLPISGYLGISRLSSLYAINISDPNLEILMRHRAMLFGILGGLFAYAAFQPNAQPFAFIAGFVSVLSFFYLAYTVGDVNSAITKIVIADVVAFIALLVATSVYVFRG